LLDRAGISDDAMDAIEPAFVHESAASEEHLQSNERLEFLGDSVLAACTATWLYSRYPDEPEGKLAKRKASLVADRVLAQSAKRLGFAELVRLGAGERATGGAERTSILADAFEAFIATLYLHAGIDVARTFVEREHLSLMDEDQAVRPDAKTELQELTQAQLACTPVYRDSGEGLPHQRIFTSIVSVDGEELGTGTGPSKKAAQQDAAAKALTTLQKRFDET
jgi:ribonuclease-3